MMYLPVLRHWSGSLVVAKHIVNLLLNHAKLALFLRYAAPMHSACIPFSVLLLEICGSHPFTRNLYWVPSGSSIETFLEVLEPITRDKIWSLVIRERKYLVILLTLLLHSLLYLGTDIMLRLDKQWPKGHLTSSLQLTVRQQSCVNRCWVWLSVPHFLPLESWLLLDAIQVPSR